MSLEKATGPGYNPGVSLDESALRSLVALLDDEDPRSLELVRRRLFDVGTTAIPFLEAARAASPPDFAARLDAMAEELRYRELKRGFPGARPPSASPTWRPAPSCFRASCDRARTPRSTVCGWTASPPPPPTAIAEDATTTEAAKRLSAHLFQSMGFAGNETELLRPRQQLPVARDRHAPRHPGDAVDSVPARRQAPEAAGVRRRHARAISCSASARTARLASSTRSGKAGRSTPPRSERMLVRNGYEFRPEYLQPCGPREILARMMRNLLSIYQKTGAVERAERLSALVEIVVTGREPGERRVRALCARRAARRPRRRDAAARRRPRRSSRRARAWINSKPLSLAHDARPQGRPRRVPQPDRPPLHPPAAGAEGLVRPLRAEPADGRRRRHARTWRSARTPSGCAPR